MWMTFVVKDFEIFKPVVEYAFWSAFDRQTRKRQRLTLQLLVYLIQVIEIKVAVATGPDKLTDA